MTPAVKASHRARMPLHLIDIPARASTRSPKNTALAESIRERLVEAGTPALNLIGGSGAGKTLLLERTLQALNTEMNIAVIAADGPTHIDVDRLARHTGRLVHGVITHGAGTLDASHIDRALEMIDLDYTDLVLVENVGSLLCPAREDLGETDRVVLYPVTDGDDQPLKYSRAFRSASHAVFAKLDLLPHVQFDIDAAVRRAREVNPELQFFFTSARTGEGLDEWLDFLRARVAARGAPALA
jgi:hydrogenase nickel incorporation protein HypB